MDIRTWSWCLIVVQYVIALQKAARKAIVQTIFTRIAIAAPVLGKQHKHHIAPTHQVTEIKMDSILTQHAFFAAIALC